MNKLVPQRVEEGAVLSRSKEYALSFGASIDDIWESNDTLITSVQTTQELVLRKIILHPECRDCFQVEGIAITHTTPKSLGLRQVIKRPVSSNDLYTMEFDFVIEPAEVVRMVLTRISHRHMFAAVAMFVQLPSESQWRIY